MLRYLFVLVLVACKTGNYKVDYAGDYELHLINQTSRPIEQVFIFPRGASNHGTSWTALQPGATTTVKIKEGMFELIAVSAERRIDAKFRERPQATTLLELKEKLKSTPRKLIFHDESETPMGVDQPGTLGVTFKIGQPEPVKEEAPPQAP